MGEGVEGGDTLTGLVCEAAGEEGESIGTGSGEEVSEDGLGEMPDGNVAWKFCVALVISQSQSNEQM